MSPIMHCMICSTTWSGSPSSASRRSAPKREKRLRLRQEQLEPLGAREQKGGRCPLSLPRIFERATACKAPRPRLTPSEVGMAAEPSRWGSSCPGPKSRNSLQVGSWGSSGPEGWNSSPPVGELALPGSADWKNTALEIVTEPGPLQPRAEGLAFPIWSYLSCYPARFMASPPDRAERSPRCIGRSGRGHVGSACSAP